MHRRNALAGLAGTVGGVVFAARAVRAETSAPAIPGVIKMSLGEEVAIGARSTAVKTETPELHINSIGSGLFRLDQESRLTATLRGTLCPYATIDYWISMAVFDAAGTMLGTAAHKEEVRCIRLGKMPVCSWTFQFDFGISKDFKDAAWVVVAINNRDVPKPG